MSYIEDLELYKEQIELGGFVGLAQVNTIAGNLQYNANKIIEFVEEAKSAKLDMILFPQNALIGFKMDDFINRYPFILEESQKWLKKIQGQPTHCKRETL